MHHRIHVAFGVIWMIGVICFAALAIDAQAGGNLPAALQLPTLASLNTPSLPAQLTTSAPPQITLAVNPTL